MQSFAKLLILSACFSASVLSLSACQTIPYPERRAAYELDMNTRFVGKSADIMVLAFGPPHSSYTLTDGREVAQYRDERTNTSGGDSYTSYDTVSRAREVINPDGSRRVVYENMQIPRTNTTPIYTRHEVCIRRFIISREKLVESFAWEGNVCFR
jgi:hypothetical protein